MCWRMQAQRDFTSEKERESKEFARFLILRALQKARQHLRFQKEELWMQRTESRFFEKSKVICFDSGWANLKLKWKKIDNKFWVKKSN